MKVMGHKLCGTACGILLILYSTGIFSQDPVPTKYWRSSFESGFPGEWLNYDNGTWTGTGVPNPGKDEAWTIVDGSEVPGGAIHGDKVYKGCLLNAAGESHRAYPCIHCDYASPLVNSWWVYLDTDYANFPSGGWHHFGTWGNNPDWDVHTMSVIGSGKLEMAHVDSFEVLGDNDMPLRRWVRFTVYVEYAPAGKNLIFAWMDSTPVMSAKNIKPGGGNLMRAHWGLYTSGNLFEGIQYNDDIQIWGLSEPWADFSRVPPSPYDTNVNVLHYDKLQQYNNLIIKSIHRGIRFELKNPSQKRTGFLTLWNMNGKFIDRCKPWHNSDRSVVYEWDGKDLQDNVVASGVYLITVKTGNLSVNTKISIY